MADRFVDKIKARMKTLRVGHSLDKCLDMGAIVDGTQRDNIESFVKQGQSEGNEIFQVEVPTNVDSALFYPPTLVTNVRGSCRCSTLRHRPSQTRILNSLSNTRYTPRQHLFRRRYLDLC